ARPRIETPKPTRSSCFERIRPGRRPYARGDHAPKRSDEVETRLHRRPPPREARVRPLSRSRCNSHQSMTPAPIAGHRRSGPGTPHQEFEVLSRESLSDHASCSFPFVYSDGRGMKLEVGIDYALLQFRLQ